MKKKIFVICDVHNCYDEMIKALDEAGFDENNPEHLLVTLGDMFDRYGTGGGAVAIYEYLKNLKEKKKVIILRGNHTQMFIDYLKVKNFSPFNYIYNGTRETYGDFLHQTAPFETWFALTKELKNKKRTFTTWLQEANKEILEEFPDLLTDLEATPYYFETKNYIFTHGAIDGKTNDWHYPQTFRYNLTGWKATVWDDGKFFNSSIVNTDKTVVIGHFNTRHLRRMYNIEDGKEEDDILVRDDGKVIALDACTNISHKVNVLVVEDEI